MLYLAILINVSCQSDSNQLILKVRQKKCPKTYGGPCVGGLYSIFYFVSDSSEVLKLLFFFSFSSPFFLNRQISGILMIFLSRIDGLLLKYEMMILYSENLSGFWFLSDFLYFLKSSDLNNFDLVSSEI